MLADLHNHSCLSPCASLELSPNVLAQSAADLGIGLLALTDHNCARNCPAFQIACRNAGILALFGLEITTAEECHVLALFDSPDTALRMDAWIWQSLPRVRLDPDLYGDQPVVDEQEHILEMIDTLLTVASSYSLLVVEQKIHEMGGLFIPAHINREAFSVESQLGFLPPGKYDAIEVLPPDVDDYRMRYPDLPVITASDAHHPDQIGQRPFTLPDTEPDIAAVRHALRSLCPQSSPLVQDLPAPFPIKGIVDRWS